MGFASLAALLHGSLVVGVSQTAVLNRGRHLYSAGRPSRWAFAHISSYFFFILSSFFPRLFSAVADWMSSCLPFHTHTVSIPPGQPQSPPKEYWRGKNMTLPPQYFCIYHRLALNCLGGRRPVICVFMYTILYAKIT